jgi:hypothetical protein
VSNWQFLQNVDGLVLNSFAVIPPFVRHRLLMNLDCPVVKLPQALECRSDCDRLMGKRLREFCYLLTECCLLEANRIAIPRARGFLKCSQCIPAYRVHLLALL